MNIGLYQSASALSALERWQESVSHNIGSSQTTGYRKVAVQFSSEASGSVRTGGDVRQSRSEDIPMLFPSVTTGINFTSGESLPTRREFDVAIQGDGFFEVQSPDGSRAYTRNGEFHQRADRTLVTSGGLEVLTDDGSPITLLPNGAPLVVNRDGTLVQGDASLGRLAVQTFADNAQLTPVAGGFFIPAPPPQAGAAAGRRSPRSASWSAPGRKPRGSRRRR